MKKTAFIIAAACAVNMALAQTNTATPDYGNNSSLATPGSLTSKFNADYPNNNPTWSGQGDYYRADFTEPANNTDRYVTYDRDGNVQMQGSRMQAEQYPGAISTYYAKKYPSEKYDVWTREDKDGNKTYYINRSSEVLWFDRDGNYTSTVKTNSKTKKTK